MPYDAQSTRDAILNSAKEEFLLHGFSDAHLRTIATDAGVTTGALYRHFKNKQALFEAIIEPPRTEMLARLAKQTEAYISLLETRGLDPMWNGEGWNPRSMVEFLYEYFDEFKLLLTQAPYSQAFIHDMIALEEESTVRYLSIAKELGYAVQIPARQEIHIIANAQYSAYFELIIDDVPMEEALKHTETVTRFFTGGWDAIILGS